MNKFYLKFGLPWVEEKANTIGFTGPTWKEDLLNDLLHDGELWAWKGFDGKEPPRPVWFLQGQRASLVCKIDDQRDDTLFCLGITVGPYGYAKQTRERYFSVPGRWAIATLGRRQAQEMTLETHLESLFANAEKRVTGVPAGSRTAGGVDSGETAKAANPFSILNTLRSSVAPANSAMSQTVAQQQSSASGRVQLHQDKPSAAIEIARSLKVNSDGSGPQMLMASTVAASEDPIGEVAVQPSRMDIGPTDAGATGVPPDGLAGAANCQATDAPLVPTSEDGSTSLIQKSAEIFESPVAIPVMPERLLITQPQRLPLDGPIRVASASSWEELAIQTVISLLPASTGIITADDPLNARRQRIARIEAELARLKEELESVPDERAILEADDLRRKLAHFGTRITGFRPTRVSSSGVGQLMRVLEALSTEVATRIPTWVLGFGVADNNGLETLLASEACQQLLTEALDWIERRFAGAPPMDLESLEAPPALGSVSDRLELAWQQEQSIRQFREEFPAEVIPVLQRAPRADTSELAGRLRVWLHRLHPNAFSQLLEILGAAESSALSRCPDPIVLKGLDDEDLLTVKEISEFKRAERQWSRAPQLRSIPDNVAPSPALQAKGTLVRFDHVVTDSRGSVVSALVVIPESEKNAKVVVLDFPVRLVASAPIGESIHIRVSSSGTSSVPVDTRLARGTLVRDGKNAWLDLQLDGDEARWEVQSDGQAYREELISVPVTLGFANELRRRKQSHWSVDMVSGQVKNNLRFERFVEAPISIGGGTGQQNETASELIERHALGAQVDHSKLETLVQEGRHAFMVVAPRRFGKTTLLHHLAERARQANHEVVEVTLERDLSPDAGVSNVWRKIKDTLEKRHNSSPALGHSLPDRLDAETPWDSVRQFTKERGFTVLHLMIDEAQVLIPRSGGEHWGNAFKNFVESYLNKPRDGFCRVQICLFGTVDLSARMGQNCKDFLLMHGVEHHVFRESSLTRFLRAVSQDKIESSRGARERMVRWTNNLRTLYALLDRVRERLTRLQRLFLLESDIDECIRDLIAPESPHAEEVWSYVRAELSHRDDWDPVDAFPLAVAWARAEVDSMNQPQRLEASAKWLSEQLQQVGASMAIVRERLDSGLRDLKARGVLRDDGSFWRPVLREMLRRKPQILQSDPGSQQALLRLSVDAVAYPSSLQLRDEGGQASIHTISQDGRTLAYRVCPLETPEERLRFARTCAALRTLRDRRTRVDGDRYLPRVSEAGFRLDNPSEGIIVYDWIEGDRLDRYPSEISWELRIHIVCQVAQAVQALHAREVIHCDIAPRNILVDSRMNVTLIDFGLARRTDSRTHTKLGPDPFKAPEQMSSDPQPRKATDIYALGMLLQGETSQRGRDIGLDPLITRMTSYDPSHRPGIAEVITKLREYSSFDVTIAEHKGRVEDIIQDAPDWLWEELMRFSMTAASSLAGQRPWDSNRAMEAAHILNNLFAFIVARKNGLEASTLADLCLGAEISLARVPVLLSDRAKLTDYPHWGKKEVVAVGHLRNAWAHPTEREAKVASALKVLGVQSTAGADVFLAPVMKVADHLDRLLGGNGNAIHRFMEAMAGQTKLK